MTCKRGSSQLCMIGGGVFGLLALVLAAGCGKPTGSVAGKVFYKGQPLKGGTVVFVTVDGKTGGRSDIAEDGSYSIADVPLGDVRITVETKSQKPNPMQARAGAAMPKDIPPEAAGFKGNNKGDRYIPIPDKYSEIESSQLIYTVIAGKQDHPIELN
jgi:hypothetical protein